MNTNQLGNDTPGQSASTSANNAPAQPKLAFEKPELVRQGSLADVTGFQGSLFF